jgi:hypothetical protein
LSEICNNLILAHLMPQGAVHTINPWHQKWKKGLCASAETRVRAAAMSAIALTLGARPSPGRLIETPSMAKFHMR